MMGSKASKQRPTKDYIVIRHGERADEMWGPEHTHNIEDTQLTDKGLKDSEKCGENLAKFLSSQKNIDNVKFIVSPFYRCIETATCLKKGFVNFMKNQKFEESRISNFEAKPLYLEEAIMERYKKRPIDEVDLLEYKCNLKKILHFAPKIELNKIVDYSNTNTRLLSSHPCKHSDQIISTCLRAFNELVKSLCREEHDDATYIIVTHGMFVRLSEHYFCQNMKFSWKVGYNYFNMFRILSVKKEFFEHEYDEEEEAMHHCPTDLVKFEFVVKNKCPRKYL